MQQTTNIDDVFVIPEDRIGSLEMLEKRVGEAKTEDQGSLRTTLSYLYLPNGPINLPKDRFDKAAPYLEQRELIIARWCRTRTNGSHRKPLRHEINSGGSHSEVSL